MSRLSEIGLALETTLAVDHGTYDASAIGKVRRGVFAEPPYGHDVFIAISSPQVVSSVGGPSAALGQWERRLTYEVQAWAPVAANDTQTRTRAGEALADELMTALEAARMSPSVPALYDTHDFVVSGLALDADFYPQTDGYATCLLTIEIAYSTAGGL